MTHFERHSSVVDGTGRVGWVLREFTAFGDVAALLVPARTVSLDAEALYELREAVNDLYDHIRQEQSTD